MTENDFTYWAFLSYSPEDNCEKRPEAPDMCCLRWGDWLHDVLATFSIPADFAGQVNARGEIIPERIDPIYQDQEAQTGNASLSESVRQALEQSKCLAVICSPRSAKSLHVNEAVRYFKQLGRGNRILSFVVAGEPNASDGSKPGKSPDDECFVPALRHPVEPDGTLDTDRRDRRSIFADARQGGDKREILASDRQSIETELETARIQLIAGLIGVGFNGLWGREQKRRFAAAQIQVRETQYQLQSLQKQVEEAQNQTRASERKALKAHHLVLEAQNQLEAARNQVREAQNKALEIQNLPEDVKSQIQETQKRVLEAQNQARDLQSQLEEARNQAREAQAQAQEMENKARQSESQLEDAGNQARTAERQLQALQEQVEEARNQTRASESKVLEAQQLAREAQIQLEATRNQVREAQDKALETQNLPEDAKIQIQEAQKRVLEAENQARNFQSQLEEARNQSREAQNKALEIQNKTNATRRLTKVLALMAVLALLAAALAAGIALRQRRIAGQALAKAASAEARESVLVADKMVWEQIRQGVQKVNGAGQDENRLRSLDELAAQIPTEKISEALKASAINLDDRQRSHFQKQLLVRLGAVSPRSAMDDASAMQGEIITDDGLSDSSLYFQLAVLDQWIKTDLPGALDWIRQLPAADARQRAWEEIIPALAADDPRKALTLLNDMQPAPGEETYTLLFQRWAANDPVQAIQQRQQIPGQDAGDNVLCAIMAVWADNEPDAALEWVKSQPDSETKNKALETLVLGRAKSDVSGALAATELLPSEAERDAAFDRVVASWAGF